MQLEFYKYQGAGNDFIIIDNRNEKIKLSKKQIAFLCDRRFGIGADGLMYLQNDVGSDFKMVYFNSDGSESTMCGNGGRCITKFAKSLGIIKQKTIFRAIDGMHQAEVSERNIRLQMIDVPSVELFKGGAIINTGSPHFIKEVTSLDSYKVFNEGRKIRNRKQK